MFGFNIIDIIAFAIFIFCFMLGIRRGFLRMTFSFLSLLISIYIAWRIHPVVSAFLRDITSLHEALQARIISALGLNEIIENYIQQGEAAVIYHLPLPGALREQLLENNTPIVHRLLGAITLEEYIGSFLAGIALNIIAAVIVFVLAIILTNLISSVLRIISRLPIIRTFDKAGGALAGILIGFIGIWIFVTLYLALFVGFSPSDGEVFNTSLVGQFLYDHDLLLRGFTGVY